MTMSRPLVHVPCFAAGCTGTTDAPGVLCSFHLGLLSRSMLCALRRAGRSGDPRTIDNVTRLAVREAQWREAMLAGKAV